MIVSMDPSGPWISTLATTCTSRVMNRAVTTEPSPSAISGQSSIEVTVAEPLTCSSSMLIGNNLPASIPTDRIQALGWRPKRDTAFVRAVREYPFGWKASGLAMDRGLLHLLSTGQRTESMFPRRKPADWRSTEESATRAYLVFCAVRNSDSVTPGCSRICDVSSSFALQRCWQACQPHS